MVDPDRPRYWRLASYTILGISACALIGALLMFLRVLRMVNRSVADPQARQVIGILSLMAGMLLIFAIFCLGLLLIRYASFRAIRRFKRTQTPFVNAWEIAGQRFKLTDENDPEPPAEKKEGE